VYAGKCLLALSAAAAGAIVLLLLLTDHGSGDESGQGVFSRTLHAGNETGMGQTHPPGLQHLTQAAVAAESFQLQENTTFPEEYNESIYYNLFSIGRKAILKKSSGDFWHFSKSAWGEIKNPQTRWGLGMVFTSCPPR
jgi:hypothetical protein